MINYSIAIMSSKPGTKKENIKDTKAYGVSQYDEKLTFDQLCQHIAEHNSPFSNGTIKGVLTDTVSCLKELLLAGNKVSLGELGEFHCELACAPAKTTDDFNASYIKAVNVRWTPGKKFENLRSEATFQLVPSRKAQANAIEVIRNEDTIPGLE